MGYYTRFNLTVSSQEEKIIKELREENEDAEQALDEIGRTNGECKWYDHEKDLKEFSLKHPKVLFTLDGEGKENGDIWKLYVKNGKSQRAKAEMKFPDYDPEKMK
jgi:hypothetical protein